MLRNTRNIRARDLHNMRKMWQAPARQDRREHDRPGNVGSARRPATDQRAIWKYPIQRRQQELLIPELGEVLHVREQGDDPCIWVRVDPDAPLRPRKFIGRMTGERFHYADEGRYLGTAHLPDGIVVHLYEVTP